MEEHLQDIPYPVRVMHWVHLVSIFSLAFTGICIRHHLLERYLVLQRRHHYYFMVIILLNLAARIVYAFRDETKTYRDFAIGWRDIRNIPQVLRYYIFLQDDYPHIAKYAAMQKVAYNLFWIMTIVQGYLGFAILRPGLLFGWGGNPDVTVIWARNIHTSIMWFFIIMTSVHMYIATIEGFPLLKLMLFGIEPEEH